MFGRIPIAFFAGFASFVAPCVLPLVPGYLSAVSSLEARRLGERGSVSRVLVRSVPFVLGFTSVFVLLGAGAGALGGAVDRRVFEEIAGFLLVVIGLAFAQLLPVPQRLVAPGLLTGARDSGSNVLLGGAFAVCAAPCVSPILVAGAVFAPAMGSFRWLRDRFRYLEVGGGLVLVALGLLFFFDRLWWLRSAFHHFF